LLTAIDKTLGDLVSHLLIGGVREEDSAWIGNPFHARGDIDTVAHQVAIALLDDIAQVDADAKFNAPLGRHPGIALVHAVLYLDSAPHGVDHAAKFDKRAISRPLHNAAVVYGYCWIDQVASKRPQARQRTILIGPG
jgi:hypothetical protein